MQLTTKDVKEIKAQLDEDIKTLEELSGQSTPNLMSIRSLRNRIRGLAFKLERYTKDEAPDMEDKFPKET